MNDVIHHCSLLSRWGC